MDATGAGRVPPLAHFLPATGAAVAHDTAAVPLRDDRIGRVGIAFEDLAPGTTFALGEVVVDRAEMLAFNQRYDPQPFHLDEQAAAGTLLGGVCASGWFTASLWMRTYVDTLLQDSTSQGSPGGREMAWPAPVFPGDRLRMAVDIVSARESASRPGLGVVELTGTAHRAEQCVLRLTFTGIFGRRAPAS